MSKLVIHTIKRSYKPYTCSKCGVKIPAGSRYHWYQPLRSQRVHRCEACYPTDAERETNPKELLRLEAIAVMTDTISNAATHADLETGLRKVLERIDRLTDSLEETVNHWATMPVAYSKRYDQYERALADFIGYRAALAVFITTLSRMTLKGEINILSTLSEVPMIPDIYLG